MNHYFYSTLRYMLLLPALWCSQAFSQADTTKMPPPPPPMEHNAGFDVIIKTNGDIVYGLVTEVAPYLIFYKRTDIPDGPIYSIARNEVYAISYRNQVKDYIQPFNDGNGMANNPYNNYNDNRNYLPDIDYKKNNLLNNGIATIGIGFLRSFTKVDKADQYSTSASMPVISLGYEVYFQDNLRVGAMLGFGNHKFTNEEFSSYDSTLNNLSLKENIFGLYVYGKYSVLSSTSRLQPYITLGLGIASSHVTSENRISFTDDDESKVILVKSGARGASLNIMARAGAEYFLNKQIQAFIDAGSGLSIINLGVAVSVK